MACMRDDSPEKRDVTGEGEGREGMTVSAQWGKGSREKGLKEERKKGGKLPKEKAKHAVTVT